MVLSQNIKPFLSALVLTLLFYVFTSKVYKVGFSYGDDYRIMVMNKPTEVLPAYLKSCDEKTLNLQGSVSFDYSIGRFRPLSWTWVKLQTLMFEDAASYYRVCNLLVFFLTVFYFLKLLLLFDVSYIYALLASLFLFYGKNAETWWSLIPPQQNIGELLIIAASFLVGAGLKKAKKPYIVIGCCLAIAASFVKESFSAFVPFIFILTILFSREFYKREFERTLLIGFGISLVPVLIILITSLTRGIYGYENTADYMETSMYNVMQFFVASAFFTAPFLFLFTKKRPFHLRLAVWSVLAVLVQLVLLTKIKMEEQHHYLSPAIMLIALLTVLSLQQLKGNKEIYAYTLFGFYGLFVFYNIKNTIVNSSYYAVKLQTFHQMLSAITHTEVNEYVYLNHSGTESDLLRGFSIHLKNKKPDAGLSHFKPVPGRSNFPGSSQKTSNPKWLVFELPDEKGSINYLCNQIGDSVSITTREKNYRFRGKLFSFSNAYNDLHFSDLFKLKFNNISQLSYKAILLQ